MRRDAASPARGRAFSFRPGERRAFRRSAAASAAAWALLCSGAFWLAAPAGAREPWAGAFSVPVAHQGYTFGNGLSPNTVGAFLAAAEKGFGAELDVQACRDGTWAVFHDFACGGTPVPELSIGELRERSGLEVPSLCDVLEAVPDSMPLIVEIKDGGRTPEGAWEGLFRVLSERAGPTAVQSFSPGALERARKACPGIPRGQLGTNYFEENTVEGLRDKALRTWLLLDFRSRPDFISYDAGHLDDWAYRMVSKLSDRPEAVWTVRDKESYERLRGRFEIVIFDGFDPSA